MGRSSKQQHRERGGWRGTCSEVWGGGRGERTRWDEALGTCSTPGHAKLNAFDATGSSSIKGTTMVTHWSDMSATLIRRPALWTMENRLRGGRFLLMPHLESVNLRPLIRDERRAYGPLPMLETGSKGEYRYDRRPS